MRYKNLITFGLAVAVSLAAAHHRWGDSSHAIGLITTKGGKARHPSFFSSGKTRYSQIATATILPPFRGDVKVLLEGDPKMDYEIHFSKPVIDLGLHRLPDFKDGILYGLQPRDRLALWVMIHPPRVDPVCGMRCEPQFIGHFFQDREYCFCSESCRSSFQQAPEKYADRDRAQGKYTLAFYDTPSGRSVLKIPLIFQGKEDRQHRTPHNH